MDNEIGGEDERRSLSRRAVIAGGAVAAAGVVGGVILSVRDRGATAAPAEPAATTAPVRPADISLPVGEFDAVEGISPFTTPLEDHFLIDAATTKPVVDVDSWSLSIGGPFVSNPMTLRYEDLLSFEHVTRQLAMVCISNPVGSDLLSNSVWTGVPLPALLDAAGIDDASNPERQIFTRGADGYSAGFRAPLAYDGRTAMVALFMNGEPLPTVHGFPARLVMAGEYAQNSAMKWLESIEVTDFLGVDGFWIRRGWAKEAPVKTSSRIDTHTSGDQLSPGPQVIAGVAWAPSHGIERVEVGIADVANPEEITWEDATIGSVESDETWVQWRYDWDAPAGEWAVWVRATDKSGFTQSSTVVPAAPDGAEGHHSAVLRV